jgi:16S rRNA (uracil1498-N3)-methyltransferase
VKPRVFVDAPLEHAGEVSLEDAAAHHLARVLRLREGDTLTLFNGRGGEWDAEFLGRRRVRLRAFSAVERESPLRITLVQGVSSGERMDYTIQKAVELGVFEIQPIACERSVVRLAAERAAKRVAHWQAVAAAACEQCGRNVVPHVLPVASLGDWLAVLPSDALRLTLSPDAPMTLRELPAPPSRVLLLVGPEGGLSPAERLDARNAAFSALRLGPRVLRTETAAVAALAAMQTLWGDF